MHIIDLRGVCCPTNFVKAKLALEMIDTGEIVQFLLDDGEPVKNVPRSLKAEGHKILGLEEKEGYSVLTLEVSSPEMRASEPVRVYSSTKITRNGREPATDPVMVEETIELIVNGTKLSSIVTTPDLHKELAVGYMVTEGAVKERKDIEEITEKDGWVFLKIRSFKHFDLWHELRSSGCIGVNWEKRDDDVILPVKQTFRIEVLLDSMKNLYDETQDRTGGAHSASLVDADGNLKYKALDIGRHNAIDKVVGSAVLNGDDLSKMFLVSSGRQPAGMVMKAVRAGIPLIISKSAPISSGIDSALRSNITLCCYATREKIKVFSAPERII
ncbi:MAG: fdhD [Geobacteraceae bacterium]|nr:fdhD [Geobacteraceae bacterium]